MYMYILDVNMLIEHSSITKRTPGMFGLDALPWQRPDYICINICIDLSTTWEEGYFKTKVPAKC